MASGSPESLADDDAHVGDAAVLDLGQHRQPELRDALLPGLRQQPLSDLLLVHFVCERDCQTWLTV